MIRTSVAVQRATAGVGEFDVIYGTYDTFAEVQTDGVIYCHGSGDTALISFMEKNQYDLITAMARHATVIAADFGGQAWGNDVAMARIHEAIAYMRASLGVTGKVILVGGSMGGATVLNYARAHPEDVKAVAGIIPLVDFEDIMSHYPSAVAGINYAYPSEKVGYAWVGAANASASTKKIDEELAVTNLAQNPSIEADTGSSALIPASWGKSYDTVNKHSGSRSVRGFKVDGSAASYYMAYLYGVGNDDSLRNTVVAGKTYTYTYWAYAGQAGYSTTDTITFESSPGVAVGAVQGPYVPVPTGTWKRIFHTFTVPAGATVCYNTTAGYKSDATNAPDGVWMDFDDVTFTEGTVAPDYFDGNTPDVIGYSEALDGPMHNPIHYAADLPADLPIKLWNAPDDLLILPATIDAFIAARPQTERTVLPPGGHSDLSVTHASAEVIKWVEAQRY